MLLTLRYSQEARQNDTAPVCPTCGVMYVADGCIQRVVFVMARSHAPGGLVATADHPAQLVGRDTLGRAEHEVHRDEPLPHREV